MVNKSNFLESIKLDSEEWCFIDTEEDYAVSSLGRVISFKRAVPHFLTIVIQESRGRKYSHVCINSKKIRVHRLVAEAFLPNGKGQREIDHINNNPLDNRVCNLRWCTHAENMRNPHTRDSERQYRLSHPLRVDTSVFYNNHEDKKKPIVQLMNGVIVAQYSSMGEAERKGYKKTSISATINGRLKSYRGFTWMLLSDYLAVSKKKVLSSGKG